MKKIKQFLAWKAENRAQRIAEFVAPWIEKGWKVLDFGAGNMLIAQKIQNITQAKISGVDVLDDNVTDLPFSLYDGHHIPLPDKSVDVTYAISVFHHIDEAEKLIAECLRVTKKRLIIHEDVFYNWFELQVTKGLDFTLNKIVSPNMHTPFNFRKVEEWVKIFESYSEVKKVHVQKVVPDPLRPTRHRLFVLDLA